MLSIYLIFHQKYDSDAYKRFAYLLIKKTFYTAKKRVTLAYFML